MKFTQTCAYESVTTILEKQCRTMKGIKQLKLRYHPVKLREKMMTTIQSMH